MVTRGEGSWGEDKSEVWDQQLQTTTYKINNQQGPTIQHGELYLIFLINSKGKESGKIDIYVYITESLCCTPETNIL